MDYLCYRLSDIANERIDMTVLSCDEQEMSATRRIARALLRAELSRRIGIAADKIVFSYNQHGKPQTEGIHFNVTHSSDIVCMAFHHAPIGIDIQQKRRLVTMDKLAPRIMCEAQLERYRKATDAANVFFTCWSIAEALVKLHGDTIWHATTYPFILHSNRVELLSDNNITVELFSPHCEYSGAIAYQTSPLSYTSE